MGLGDCATCDGSRCASRAGEYDGVSWPKCPVRFVAEDRRLQLALRMVRAKSFAPPADYPDGCVAWVATYAPAVERAVVERARHDAQGGGT
ncbi:MAG: hypothetical protein H6698_09630 [Myxococcales bacterium]|nr:hypothetical protein [Myxococcales bacterium]MCB9532640.1 hypothetical protein [Myxococcales bacterium]MCB9534542.1 hypothetical protein [Myxococcales bacterium]